MTHKEFQQLPWRMRSHLAMEHENALTYEANIGFKQICKCVHTVIKDDFTFGRSYTHYMFDGKVYKSHVKALDAINEYLEKVKA